MPEIEIKYITQLCNTVFRRLLYNLCYFSPQWKVAQIIMIQKPVKPAKFTESYRSISLLSVLSKLFEKLLFSRIIIIMENHGLPTINSASKVNTQQSRIVKRINNNNEADRYCSAIFLDVLQAFDKVWHRGLLYKIKKISN